MTRLETVAVGLATEAHTDPVTAIGNRREFDQRIALELDRAARHGRPLSLVICDLDRFKAVNDALGHEEGDVALRRAAAAIGAAVRSVDAVARLGGEEFGVILPETGASRRPGSPSGSAPSVSDEFSSYAFKLTASCGVACTDDVDGGRDALFRAADGALYLAKREGRNRVIAHPVDEPRARGGAGLVGRRVSQSPGWAVVSGGVLGAGDLERLAQAAPDAELDQPLNRHPHRQHRADPARGDHPPRAALDPALDRVDARAPAGATRVNGPPRRSIRSAALVAKPRRVMSVSSSAK